MYYTGIDLYKETSFIIPADEKGGIGAKGSGKKKERA